MENKKVKIYEKDLYVPIRAFFTQQGYEVYGEVHDCDITAIKENELIIIELKLNLTIELLIQATKRQRYTDLVYIAIPKPKYSLRSKKWTDILHLIRRLELGLIFVSFTESGAHMEIKAEPTPFDRYKSMQRSKKKRESIIKETNGRSGDYNIGGSNQVKIMTAYKENCIHIACCLIFTGASSPKVLRQMGTGDKTLSILNQNYYGWFEKIKRGTYKISEAGTVGIVDYPELVIFYNEKIKKLASIE